MSEITLKIKTTTSPDIHDVKVDPEGKVKQIMEEINKYSGTPIDKIKLIYKGKILKEDDSIKDYEMKNEDVLIFVKSALGSQPKPQQQQEVPAQSNNPEDNIKIIVRTSLNSDEKEMTVNKNMSILGLKAEIEKFSNVPKTQQKIVRKGRVLDDSKTLDSLGFTNGSTCSMLKIGQNTSVPNLGGLGAGLNLGMMGRGRGSNAGTDPATLAQAMALMNNPELFRQLVQNSPVLQEMANSNPMMRTLLNNPAVLRQALSELEREGGLGRGLNPGGQQIPNLGNLNLGNLGMGRGRGAFSGFAPSQQNNNNLGDIFSNFMRQQEQGPHSGQGLGNLGLSVPQQPQQQFQPPQPQPNVDYKTLYKDQIAQIKDMGFDDEDKIIDALIKCQGNVQFALEKLFA